MEQRLEERRKNFKKAVDTAEARRKREDMNVQLRKQKRDEHLQKKRYQGDEQHQQGNAETANAAMKSTFMTELFPQMVQGVMSLDPQAQFVATQQFRRLLSIEQHPPIQDVIEANVVPRFVEFLKDFSRPELQFEGGQACECRACTYYVGSTCIT